jgi:hypothetical protein
MVFPVQPTQAAVVAEHTPMVEALNMAVAVVLALLLFVTHNLIPHQRW